MNQAETQRQLDRAREFLSPNAEGQLSRVIIGLDQYEPVFTTNGLHQFTLTELPGTHPALVAGPAILIGGEMVLPLSNPQDAWRAANYLAEECGYLASFAKRGGASRVTVILHGGPPWEVRWDAQGFVGIREVR